MAKMKLNPAVNGLSGKLGKMVHRNLWGIHVVSALPDLSHRVLTPKQIEENNKFRTAALVWRTLPDEIKAVYAAWGKRLNKPPYALFSKNCCRPPMIEAIDVSQYRGQAGQKIAIRAVDLIQVAAVEVTVQRVGGSLIEKGSAARVLPGSDVWMYQTTASAVMPADLVVQAVATNFPGKQGDRIALVSVLN